MSTSDDLFRLIKSLTKNEKGYFKKNSAFHTIGEQNKYIALFNAIEKQKHYDEQAIREKFAGERFLKQLNVTKLYLYNSILKSAENYKSSVRVVLQSHISRIEFLMDKNLFDLALRLLYKAKKLAKKHERFYELGLLYDLEFRWLSSTDYQQRSDVEVEQIYGEVMLSIEASKNFREMQFLTIRLSKIFPRAQDDWKKINEIMHNSLLKSVKNTLSNAAANYYYFTHALYNEKKQDIEKTYYYSKKSVESIEELPHQITDAPILYVNALRSHCICLIETKRFSEVPEVLRKMRSINIKSNDLKRKIHSSSILNELDYYITTGEFYKGLKLIQAVTKEGEQSFTTGDRLSYTFLSLQVYFGMENYSKAIKFLNEILNDPLVDEQSAYYSFAKIFSIIVYFEKGDEDLLEYVVKSTYRYLYKRNRLFKFENMILQFIEKKLPLLSSHQKRMVAFKELKTEIELLARNKQETQLLRYFDFVSWLESKIQKKMFAEIVKGKL